MEFSEPDDRDLNVDFASLAQQDEAFAEVLKANGGRLNFHDPQAVKYFRSAPDIQCCALI
jgi:hypothetical protein